MVWFGRNLIDHLIPTPLPWAATPSTRLGWSKPHPTWKRPNSQVTKVSRCQ